MTTPHTPLPWWTPPLEPNNFDVYDAEDSRTCVADEKAIAEFVVQAVNERAQLFEALEDAEAIIGGLAGDDWQIQALLATVRAALKLNESQGG